MISAPWFVTMLALQLLAAAVIQPYVWAVKLFGR